jgi:RecB family endonuclease NucS
MEMTCRHAIEEIFDNHEGALSEKQIVGLINKKYPKKWEKGTIRNFLVGMSVNHRSRKNHPSYWKHDILYFVEGKGYRKYDRSQDGLWETTKDGTRRLDLIEEETIEAEKLEALETSLSMERDLERSLIQNLGQLEPNLRLFQDQGISGQELDTGEVGRIDILCVDGNKNLVVIELKAGKADERVCGQILRYMGWVKENLADNRNVRGIIIANEFTESLRYAVKAMPDVTLKRYEFYFKFTDI